VLNSLLKFSISAGMLFHGPEAGTVVNGVIWQSWHDPNGTPHVRGFPQLLPVRLCSLDRILQTQSDPLGAFLFANVPPGVYELSTGRQVVPARSIKGIEIKAGNGEPVTQRPVTLNMDIDDPKISTIAGSDCFRDTPPPRLMDCEPFSFQIEYGPWSERHSASLSGQVTDWNGKKSKGLVKARVVLSNPDDAVLRYSALTDKHGLFQFVPPAGVYDLTVSVEGFHESKITRFLVPRENDTRITIRTDSERAVIICQ